MDEMGTETAFQYYIWNVVKIRKKKIKSPCCSLDVWSGGDSTVDEAT